MNQRLFQDAGGTTPAIIAGQPVGLIKRLAGSVDATQATALSKPTLARHPRSGKTLIQNRNVWDEIPLGILSSAYSQNGFLVRQGTDGVTTEIVGRGYDESGLPYLDVRYSGQNNHASNIQFLNVINDDVVPLPDGVTNVQVTALVTLLSGSLGNSSTVASLQPYVNFRDGAGLTITGNSAYLTLTLGVERRVTVNSLPPAGVVSVINRGIYVRIPLGATIDATVRIKALQSSFVDDAPFQIIRSPNDIRQAGVADLWHLYNDGGDSLNVTLPAGIYGLASIDINRAITITTVSSDGTTPINTLRHERQLDVILRASAFSAGEETAIRDYWGRVFA